MPVIKKVQLKVALPPKEEQKEKVSPDKAGVGKEERVVDDKSQAFKGTVKAKKVCQFCKNETEPKYWDVVALRRYLNDRGRIVSRSRYGCCAKHQRRVSREIKRARHLALLPFTVGLH